MGLATKEEPSFLEHPDQEIYRAMLARAEQKELSGQPEWALVIYRAALETLAGIYDQSGHTCSDRANSVCNQHVDALLKVISKLEDKLNLCKEHRL